MITHDEIVRKLAELSQDGCFFCRSLLAEHNLFNIEAINILYHDDCLDVISYQEALDALPLEKETIRRRRKAANASRESSFVKIYMKNKYAPGELLDDIGQYGIILKKRDEYMPFENAIERLNITKTTLVRHLHRNKSSLLWGQFITTKDFNRIHEFLNNYISPGKAAFEMGMSRRYIYNLIKNKGIVLVNHKISRSDLEFAQQHQQAAMTYKDVARRLNIGKSQYYRIRKKLGICFQKNITEDEFNILKDLIKKTRLSREGISVHTQILKSKSDTHCAQIFPSYDHNIFVTRE